MCLSHSPTLFLCCLSVWHIWLAWRLFSLSLSGGLDAPPTDIQGFPTTSNLHFVPQCTRPEQLTSPCLGLIVTVHCATFHPPRITTPFPFLPSPSSSPSISSLSPPHQKTPTTRQRSITQTHPHRLTHVPLPRILTRFFSPIPHTRESVLTVGGFAGGGAGALLHVGAAGKR